MTWIETAMLIGSIVGVLAGLIPRRKTGCAALLIIPFVMVVYTVIELNDPSRTPDAQDALYLVFNPAWPSLGAIIGFSLVRLIRGLVLRKNTNDS